MKSFIIHLSKIEASLTTALNLKKQLENYNMPAELVEGTYGSDAVRMMEEEGRTMHPFGIKGPPKADAPPLTEEQIQHNLKAQGPGVKGCFYSHYKLWQKCVELNEPIIIWEDDIVLTRAYIPIDWQDVLILALGHPGKSEKYKHHLENPEGKPGPADYHQSSMPGCCGYAIKPHAAKKLVETYSKTFLPADNAINQHHVRIQIHNHAMGIALIKKDGKKSLTRTTFWDSYNIAESR
jgi:GR25 family glycosyltransferase involved in LPS biosynthesis